MGRPGEQVSKFSGVGGCTCRSRATIWSHFSNASCYHHQFHLSQISLTIHKSLFLDPADPVELVYWVDPLESVVSCVCLCVACQKCKSWVIKKSMMVHKVEMGGPQVDVYSGVRICFNHVVEWSATYTLSFNLCAFIFSLVFCVYLDCICRVLWNIGFLVSSSSTVTFIKRRS